MSDEDVVRKFGNIAAHGAVWQKGQSEKMELLGRKKLWQWKSSGPKSIDFMLALMPHLGYRRSMQFLDMLSKIKEVNRV